MVITGRTRNALTPSGVRGFESHRLRQDAATPVSESVLRAALVRKDSEIGVFAFSGRKESGRGLLYFEML